MEIATSQSREVDNLLSSLREAGQLDSHGSFTLAAARAAGKLAQSLLPDPADWILKVVQAACQGQAPELRISQTQRATHIEFQLPYIFDLRAFEDGLVHARVASQPGVDDLCAALRVLGLGQQRSWVVRLTTGSNTHWVVTQDGEVSLETASGSSGPPGVTQLLLGIAFPPGESGKLGGLVRFGAAIQNEHEALSQRARACPIPLWLDGTRLDTLERSDSLSGLEQEFFLGVFQGDNPNLTPIQRPVGLSQSVASRFADRLTAPGPFCLSPAQGEALGSSVMRVAFRYYREPGNHKGRLLTYRKLDTPSRVLLVRHGVVVGKRNLGLTEAVAVDVYLDAGESRTDLSGLQIEVNSEHVATARGELISLGPFLDVVEKQLAEHSCRFRSQDLILHGGLNGLALLLAPWPLKLVTLGYSVTHLKITHQQYRKVVADCVEEVSLFQRRYCRPSVHEPSQQPQPSSPAAVMK